MEVICKRVFVTDLSRMFGDMTISPTYSDTSSSASDQHHVFVGLARLPTEILSAVCAILDDTSLVCLRLVSRDMAHKSAFAFGARFFTTVAVVLHPQSLETLWEILHSPALSQHVQTVIFDSEYPPGGPNCDDLQLGQALRDILAVIPRLRTLRIDSKSYQGGYGHRKLGLAVCRCGRKILTDKGMLPASRVQADGPEFTHVCQIVLSVFMSGAIKTDVSLDICISASHWKIWSRPEPVDYISAHLTPSVREHIQRIELSYVLPCQWGRDLIISLPELRDLSIYGGSHFKILDDLNISTTTIWPNLSVLDLKRGDIDGHTLISLLSTRASTLAHIYLGTLWMSKNQSWVHSLRALRGMRRLKNLDLDRLGFRAPTAEANVESQDDDQFRICLNSREDIVIAIDILCAILPRPTIPLEAGNRMWISFSLPIAALNCQGTNPDQLRDFLD